MWLETVIGTVPRFATTAKVPPRGLALLSTAPPIPLWTESISRKNDLGIEVDLKAGSRTGGLSIDAVFERAVGNIRWIAGFWTRPTASHNQWEQHIRCPHFQQVGRPHWVSVCLPPASHSRVSFL